MTNEMRLLLQSLIKSAQAQIGQLNHQIGNYTALLEYAIHDEGLDEKAIDDAIERGLVDRFGNSGVA